MKKKTWFGRPIGSNKGPRDLDKIQIDYTNACAMYGVAKHRHDVTLPQELKALEQRVSNLQVELEMRSRYDAEKKAQDKVPEAGTVPNLTVVE